MERAGGQADDLSRHIEDALLAEPDQVRVEGYRLDRPDARPLHGAAFLLGKGETRGLGLAVHGGEDLGVQVALV